MDNNIEEQLQQFQTSLIEKAVDTLKDIRDKYMLAVKDAGGINIRVERPLHTRFKEHYFEFEMDRTMDRYEFEVFLIEEKSLSLRHPSETSLDNYEDWDYVIK